MAADGSERCERTLGEASWWWAVVLSSLVPLTYVMMGGMRSSLFSDVVQAAMAVIFLFVILGVIGQEMGAPAWSKWPSWWGHGWPPRSPLTA